MKTYYGFREDSKELHKEPILCRQFEDSDMDYVFYMKYIVAHKIEYTGYCWFTTEEEARKRLSEILNKQCTLYAKRSHTVLHSLE